MTILLSVLIVQILGTLAFCVIMLREIFRVRAERHRIEREIKMRAAIRGACPSAVRIEETKNETDAG